MTRQDALNWLNAQKGKSLDYESLVLWLNSVIASKTMTSAVVLFTNRATDNTGVVVPSPLTLPSVVNTGMFLTTKYHKILWAIVQLVMVNVMNNFVFAKKSANSCLSNVSVFSHITLFVSSWILGHVKESISSTVDNTTPPFRVEITSHLSSLTSIRAKHKFAPLMRTKVFEPSAAVGTVKPPLPGYVVAIPTAISSLLRRWSFEFAAAMFACVNHLATIIQTSMHLVKNGETI